jgi:hypothetical protein
MAIQPLSDFVSSIFYLLFACYLKFRRRRGSGELM